MAPFVVDDLPTGTPTNQSDTRVLTGAVRIGGMVVSTGLIFWADDGADVVTVQEPQDVEFSREKHAFLGISPFALARYKGLFVASRGGHIVDADPDMSVLVSRFFTQYGNVPVYITKVGQDQDELRIDTPFFE